MSSDRCVKTRCRPIETHGSDQTVGASVASNVTASDGWTRRADVVCVGADLRVRPTEQYCAPMRTGGLIDPPLPIVTRS